MSIRFIGYESYVPSTPGNYAKGKTKVIRISTLPNEQEQNIHKVNRYREELDRQVEEIRKRKNEARVKEQEQDERRQKLFYESLELAKRHAHHQPHAKNVNFHILHRDRTRLGEINPQQQNQHGQDSDDTFHFESRLAHIGKQKIKLDMPVFQSRGDLVFEEQNYNDLTIDRRRRLFIEQMDRSLLDAHMSIERSKTAAQVDDELEKLKKRLRTDESRLISQIQYNEKQHYNLPYRSPLYNSPSQYHRRDRSLM